MARRLFFGNETPPRKPEPGRGRISCSCRCVGERRPQPLLQTPFEELNAEISPDGRWLAYQSNESGPDEIYVRPFPNVDAGKWQVSTSGGRSPCGRGTGGNSSTCRWAR